MTTFIDTNIYYLANNLIVYHKQSYIYELSTSMRAGVGARIRGGWAATVKGIPMG